MGYTNEDGTISFDWPPLFRNFDGCYFVGCLFALAVRRIVIKYFAKEVLSEEASVLEEREYSLGEEEYEYEEEYEEEWYEDEEEYEVTESYIDMTPKEPKKPKFELVFDVFGENVEDDMYELVRALEEIPGFNDKIDAVDVVPNADDDQGKVQLILIHDDPETLMYDPGMMKAMELLGNAERIQNINVNEWSYGDDDAGRTESDQVQEMLELTFKTYNEDDINEYHQVLHDFIMNTEGFAEKVHEKDIQVVDDNNGEMKFLLMQKADTAMMDPAIAKILDLLQEESDITDIALDETDPLVIEEFKEEDYGSSDDHDEYLELSFKTKDKNGDIESFHERLLQRLFDFSAFKEKVYHYDVKAKTKEKGKMKFILMQDAATAMEDNTIKKILDILQNNGAIKSVNLDVAEDVPEEPNRPSGQSVDASFEEEADEYEEILEVGFKTTGDDIEVYQQELLEEIMAIPGFKEKYHSHEAEIHSDNAGKMNLLLKQNPETAMEDPVIQALLDLLENNDRINKVKSNEKEEEKKEDLPPAKEWQEMIELTFNTQRGSGILQIVHEAVVKKIMNTEGFYDLLYDYECTENDDKNGGNMRFMIKHNADTAMDNPVIKTVLDILGAEDMVEAINLDETAPVEKHDGRVSHHKHKTHLTKAIIMSFTIKHEDVEAYGKELEAECMAMDYFRHKLYDNKITQLRSDKAKWQMICYHDDSEERDPELVEVSEWLLAKEGIKNMKFETIPYFLEC